MSLLKIDESPKPRLEILFDPRLSDADLDALAAIEEACYAPRLRYSRRTLRRFLDCPGSLLTRAWMDDALAGFQLSNRDYGQLITLDVHPRHRRKGIGSQLLSLTLQTFVQCGQTFARCEISIDNEASIRLHEKFGFFTLGVIERYYENRGDALAMGVLLDTPAFQRIRFSTEDSVTEN